MIEGTAVRLRALRAEDAEHQLRWRNDPEVVRLAAAGDPRFGPTTAEALADRFGRILRLDPRESGVLTVEEKTGGRPIGMVDYRGVDPYEGVAEVGIFIGEREFWDHGYGSEALGLLVDHLFGMFPLNRLELDTWSGNTRAARAFARLGFQEEGRRRDAVLLAGVRYDRLLFGLLRREWEARRRSAPDAPEATGATAVVG
ncbi:Protein N-acetyltransferase, RimJ/RimL family [Streptomyces sp. TLI_053]|uniref:GNAT family N-acetyltransferase n=1 Tax=Streptomyces sp. TLI_053 TaxID=1855352 RepID=UPI00087AE153|nr:GNAT family protein [Streptomyces sp. TLI_053]SDT33891.1 Protein N-acetyltransferase, RimJ/RimL family [Streptomyces sp. TLI_053]